MRSIIIALALVACSPVAPLPPIVPADVPVGSCQAAQQRLEQLGCQEARTPGGLPFGEVCEDAAADGRSFCPVAVSHVTACSQVEDAAAGKRGEC